jgi:hypothetical protein
MIRKFTVGTERMLQKMGRKSGTETPEEFEDANARFKALCVHLEAVHKTMKDFVVLSNDFCESGYKWSQTMSEFGRGSTTELGVCLVKFGNKFEAILDLQHSVERSIADNLLKPLMKFDKEDVEQAKKPKAEYKRSHYEYDRLLTHYEKLKTKSADPHKVQVEERRVEEARSYMSACLGDAVKSLNYTWEKGDYEYLKGMLAVMRSYESFFRDGQQIMEGLRPYIAQLDDAISRAERGETDMSSVVRETPKSSPSEETARPSPSSLDSPAQMRSNQGFAQMQNSAAPPVQASPVSAQAI